MGSKIFRITFQLTQFMKHYLFPLKILHIFFITNNQISHHPTLHHCYDGLHDCYDGLHDCYDGLHDCIEAINQKIGAEIKKIETANIFFAT